MILSPTHYNWATRIDKLTRLKRYEVAGGGNGSREKEHCENGTVRWVQTRAKKLEEYLVIISELAWTKNGKNGEC